MLDSQPPFAVESFSIKDRRTDRRRYATALKRACDLVLTLVLIGVTAPVLLPLLAVIGWLVSRDGHSAIFRQKRIGRGGQVFEMLKFRTMVADAEERLTLVLGHHPEMQEEWLRHQKLRDDPRVTGIGRVLRATSLDELPQIWNVLRGDMALVGPRPMLPGQARFYPGTAYYRMRPGITGPWQIAGRHRTSFTERAAYDERYAESMSLCRDLAILLRTVPAVLRATGI